MLEMKSITKVYRTEHVETHALSDLNVKVRYPLLDRFFFLLNTVDIVLELFVGCDYFRVPTREFARFTA